MRRLDIARIPEVLNAASAAFRNTQGRQWSYGSDGGDTWLLLSEVPLALAKYWQNRQSRQNLQLTAPQSFILVLHSFASILPEDYLPYFAISYHQTQTYPLGVLVSPRSRYGLYLWRVADVYG